MFQFDHDDERGSEESDASDNDDEGQSDEDSQVNVNSVFFTRTESVCPLHCSCMKEMVSIATFIIFSEFNPDLNDRHQCCI